MEIFVFQQDIHFKSYSEYVNDDEHKTDDGRDQAS